MPTVHPTAILDGDVQLDDDVVVGPGCVLTGPARIGRGCRLIGNVWIQGPVEMGAENTAYPFVCLGFAPQHLRFDPSTPGRGLHIGDGNTFREHVTVHRAFTDEAPTTIGDRNYFMTSSHAGHDCRIGSDCVLVSGALLGGHVDLGDAVTVGGGAVIHQFVRIGRCAMLSGSMGLSLDVPPFFMLTGPNICGSVNLIGMRRRGLSREEIDDVRWAFRVIQRSGLSRPSALERLHERAERPLVAECLQFIESSQRGICPARAKPIRGSTV